MHPRGHRQFESGLVICDDRLGLPYTKPELRIPARIFIHKKDTWDSIAAGLYSTPTFRNEACRYATSPEILVWDGDSSVEYTFPTSKKRLKHSTYAVPAQPLGLGDSVVTGNGLRCHYVGLRRMPKRKDVVQRDFSFSHFSFGLMEKSGSLRKVVGGRKESWIHIGILYKYLC
ncbi:hypothetical protein V490_04589 [Pseudogymnoascus sp. VKM F-3557]|nr:hypothetical protein V490_04589 [Pseudogymnoascus sp. VKM F-3557]